RAGPTQQQSLFWALRVGGGRFALLTSFDFALYPLATVHAGMMVWDIDDAERVVRAWAEWAPEAAEEITTSMRTLNLPQSPDIPETVGGRPVVSMDAAVLADEARGQRIL